MNVKKHIQSKDIIKSDAKAFSKLINIISYILTLESKTLNLTRLLKFLYIIDEKSVLKIGTPVTNLEYKVAGNGPLADRLWFCILDNPEVFTEYFDIKITKYIRAQKETCRGSIYSSHTPPDLKFLSKFEDALIKETVQKYKGVHTEDIINELHGDDTLWGKIKKKNNIDFKKLDSNISKYKIDFHDLISDNDLKADSYKNYLLRKA